MMVENQENLLIGVHPVAAALRSAPGQLRQITIAAEASNPRVRELLELARQQGIPVQHQPRASLDRRSRGERHQDVMAEFAGSNLRCERDIPALLAAIDGPPLILVLDGVQDPHNLGACLRSAEAAGVHFVILPKDRSAGLSPVARKAACGAAEVLQLVTVTNLARVLRLLKQHGLWLAGTADDAAQSLYQAGLGGPLALIVGSEGKGLRRLTAELCDYAVRIPMSGTVNSLNVSVATAVCLFEIVRQRSAQS